MRQIVFDDRATWNFSKETLKQFQNLVELIYKNRNGYDALTESMVFKNYMIATIYKLYAYEPQKLVQCSKAL